MHSSIKTAFIGATMCPLILISITNPVLAGGGDGTTPATTPSVTPPTSESAPSGITSSNSTVSPFQVNQQFSNGSSLSSLAPPSCITPCGFVITRISPSNSGASTNFEAIAGITIPFGSTDGGVAELNRINGETQKFRTEHETKLALSRELAEAIKNGDRPKAVLIAINLAPMLGYKTYQSLLKELSDSQPPIGNVQLGMVQISSPPIMF